MKNQTTYTWLGIFIAAALTLVACDAGPRHGNENAGATTEPEFSDARQQAKEFIAYYHSIALTPEQERIKQEALEPIPAPCCKNFSIATCCCPCNLAKSTWGLAHLLIARRGFDAAQTRDVAERWLRFTNANGYAGDACHRGRCSLPFDQDGCGGMREDQLS